jgi:hypothetical protein
MAYYLAKVNIETGEINRKGELVSNKEEILIAAESVVEAETRVAEFFSGTTISYETVQITKSKINSIIQD